MRFICRLAAAGKTIQPRLRRAGNAPLLSPAATSPPEGEILAALHFEMLMRTKAESSANFPLRGKSRAAGIGVHFHERSEVVWFSFRYCHKLKLTPLLSIHSPTALAGGRWWRQPPKGACCRQGAHHRRRRRNTYSPLNQPALWAEPKPPRAPARWRLEPGRRKAPLPLLRPGIPVSPTSAAPPHKYHKRQSPQRALPFLHSERACRAFDYSSLPTMGASCFSRPMRSSKVSGVMDSAPSHHACSGSL